MAEQITVEFNLGPHEPDYEIGHDYDFTIGSGSGALRFQMRCTGFNVERRSAQFSTDASVGESIGTALAFWRHIPRGAEVTN